MAACNANQRQQKYETLHPHSLDVCNLLQAPSAPQWLRAVPTKDGARTLIASPRGPGVAESGYERWGKFYNRTDGGGGSSMQRRHRVSSTTEGYASGEAQQQPQQLQQQQQQQQQGDAVVAQQGVLGVGASKEGRRGSVGHGGRRGSVEAMRSVDLTALLHTAGQQQQQKEEQQQQQPQQRQHDFGGAVGGWVTTGGEGQLSAQQQLSLTDSAGWQRSQRRSMGQEGRERGQKGGLMTASSASRKSSTEPLQGLDLDALLLLQQQQQQQQQQAQFPRSANPRLLQQQDAVTQEGHKVTQQGGHPRTIRRSSVLLQASVVAAGVSPHTQAGIPGVDGERPLPSLQTPCFGASVEPRGSGNGSAIFRPRWVGVGGCKCV